MTILGFDPRLQNLSASERDKVRARRLEHLGETIGHAIAWASIVVAVAAILFLASALLASRAKADMLSVDGSQIRVIDGDTVDLPCPSRAACERERVRIWNIDAPETSRARCLAERAAGYASARRLENLIRGRQVAVERCDPKRRCEDRNGRTLARLIVNGADVGESLIASGHALPWRDGAEARGARLRHWCGEAS